LATYQAEVGGVVDDDPASSLDHLGITYLDIKKAPLALVSMVQSHSSSDVSSTVLSQ
jgi:hypothetical protein